MIHPRPTRPRGFTVTIVLISLLLLFGIWAYACRTTSSLIQVETSRLQRQTSDQGAINALSQALQLLQYSPPPSPGGSASTYYMTLKVPDTTSIAANSTTVPSTWVYYQVVYQPQDSNSPCLHWQVQVSPVAADSVDPNKTLPSSVPVHWP